MSNNQTDELYNKKIDDTNLFAGPFMLVESLELKPLKSPETITIRYTPKEMILIRSNSKELIKPPANFQPVEEILNIDYTLC